MRKFTLQPKPWQRRIVGQWLYMVITGMLVLMTGCQTPPSTDDNSRDPLQNLNRPSHQFNDRLDKMIIKPITKIYRRRVPENFRKKVSSFYNNLNEINVGLNDLLQGKYKDSVTDIGRMLVNSTYGLGGLYDVASDLGMEQHDEDFGQTLAVWGVGEGPYLGIPFLGPSTMRDAPGKMVTAATNVLFYIRQTPPGVSFGMIGMVDERSQNLDHTDVMEEEALDQYIYIREAYRQRRDFLIYDGDPPADLFYDDIYDDEEEPDADE